MLDANGLGEAERSLGRLAALEAENARLRAALAEARRRGGGVPAPESFQAIADSIDQMIWSTRPDGYHDYFNGRWYEYTGVPEGSTDGEEWNGMFHPDDQDAAWTVWRRSLATGEPYQIEYRLRHRSGEYRWVLGRAQPVRDENGEIARWYGTCTDIHELKTARDALSASRARLAAFMENTPDALFIKDVEGRYVMANPAFLTRVGKTLDEVVGQTDVDIFGPELGEAFRAEDAELRLAGVPRRFEESFEYGGERLTVLTQKFPLPDGQIGCIATEISERKAAEEALRESEARFRAMADSLPVPAWVTGSDGIDFANRAFADFAGQASQQLLGEAWQTIIHPDDLPRLIALRDEAHARAEPFGLELRARRSDGKWRTLQVNVRPRMDTEGASEGYVGVAVDLTDLHASEEAARRSEERLRVTLAAGALGDWTWDAGTDRVWLSDEAAALFGLENIDGLTWTALQAHIEPGDAARAAEAVSEAVASHADYSIEYRVVRPDGRRLWVSAVGRPLYDNSGRPSGMVGALQDVTARREAEQALQEETRTLETLNEIGAAVAAELDQERLVQMVTDAGVELTGAEFGAFFYNVLNEAGESYMLYTLSGAERSDFEDFGMPRATGVFHPTFVGEGTIRSDDITKDRRYGKNAPHSGMPEGHLPVRSYLAVSVISRSGEVIGGLFFGHPDVGRFTERHERLMTGIAGQAATAMDNARLFSAAQRLNQTLEVQVEERTAERDRMWRLSTDIMLVAGFDSKVAAVNPAWTTVLGWEDEDLVGTAFLDLVHPDDVEATLAEVARLEEGLKTLRFENRYRHQDGSYRWISWTAVPDANFIHAVGRDVTAEKLAAQELERAQEALRQAQKMETVGQLTGGVAHDFNNLLQVVTGNLEILLRNLPADASRLRRSAENAARGAERAAVLTQRLLAFSRRQPLAPKAIEPNKLVGGMSEILHRTLGETIEVETVLASGLWRVEVDPNQLENAILNLAVNARDAMPEGGKLTIETCNTHLDRGYTASNAEVAPGQYIVICVSDTGAGMDQETVSRAFEPFFTTKEVGKGTGLGLSMVYGFVKQSGGHLKIYSEIGEGTTVKIYLPRLVGGVDEEEEASANVVPEGTREETILVCEDDDDVRAYSVEVLRELGYRVLEAHDGPSALRLLERQEGRVDLLFTDVVLPSGMTGAVLADQAREIRPGLKVLFTTGYARNAIVHHGRLDAGVELITKPFSYADLAARIRDILDAAS